MSFDALYFNRRTRDILEDYDLELYADPNGYPGPIDDPNSLYLGLDYFGYAANPGSNFVIGTLAGGKRNFQGLEFVFRKRFADRWQLLTSYNWNDGEGNTNSDSNADFQGDVIYLDPRAPNQFGTQPGLIKNLLKGGGSYTFDFGLQLGGTFTWNSGTIASRTFLSSSRNLPMRVDCRRRVRVRRLSPRGGWRRTRWVRSRTRRGARSICGRSTCARSGRPTSSCSSTCSTSPTLRAPSATRIWWRVRAARRSGTRSSGSTRAAPSWARACASDLGSSLCTLGKGRWAPHRPFLIVAPLFNCSSLSRMRS